MLDIPRWGFLPPVFLRDSTIMAILVWSRYPLALVHYTMYKKNERGHILKKIPYTPISGLGGVRAVGVLPTLPAVAVGPFALISHALQYTGNITGPKRISAIGWVR